MIYDWVQRQGGLHACETRTLNWLALALSCGPDHAREQMLALQESQCTMLSLFFGAASGVFSILPEASDLAMFLGVVSMVIPLLGALLVVVYIGALRQIPAEEYIGLLLDSNHMAAAPTLFLRATGLSFVVTLVIVVMQRSARHWVWASTLIVSLVCYPVVTQAADNMREQLKARVGKRLVEALELEAKRQEKENQSQG